MYHRPPGRSERAAVHHQVCDQRLARPVHL